MDPWLERFAVFPILRGRLIYGLGAALSAALPPGYVAVTDSRVNVDPELTRVPDVGVYGPNGPPNSSHEDTVATLTRAGLLAVAGETTPDPVEEVYLEVRSAYDDRLVTAVEAVSPAN
jgi:hypothetical protein